MLSWSSKLRDDDKNNTILLCTIQNQPLFLHTEGVHRTTADHAEVHTSSKSKNLSTCSC